MPHAKGVHNGKLSDPAWRVARARKAGAAARHAHLRRARENATRYRSKADAYVAGHQQGYAMAYRAWQRRMDWAMARLRGAR